MLDQHPVDDRLLSPAGRHRRPGGSATDVFFASTSEPSIGSAAARMLAEMTASSGRSTIGVSVPS
jgi:hypothetical protein